MQFGNNEVVILVWISEHHTCVVTWPIDPLFGQVINDSSFPQTHDGHIKLLSERGTFGQGQAIAHLAEDVT